VVVVLILAPVSEVYKIMFVIPHVALDSSMACRVFRGLKLGFIDDIEECSRSMQSSRPQIVTQQSNITTVLPSNVFELNPCTRQYGPEVQWKAEPSFHEGGVIVERTEVRGWI
jgi:hypothetical protein